MKTEILRVDHPIALQHAVDVLLHGGTVAFPTDTVYGLAALAFEARTIDSLYIVKGRNSQRAIAVLIGDITQLTLVVAQMPPMALPLAEAFWPGPLTLVVPGNPKLPANLSPTSNIGVRMPNHPFALALIRQTGPLAVTSANLSGQESCTTAEAVYEQLQGRLHLIIDGGTSPGGVPSTVVDCTGSDPMVLREGPISAQQIFAALG
jgi:L-threonylcarbamoyladenylate synthase